MKGEKDIFNKWVFIMNEKQLQQLSKIKKLITLGKCRFVIRKDRDYLRALLIIGINEKEAWREILSLNKGHYVVDYCSFYWQRSDALTFKKYINGYLIYIKIKIENINNIEEIAVCLSFHIDERNE